MSKVQGTGFFGLLTALVILCNPYIAHAQQADSHEIQRLIKTLQGPNITDSPRYATSEDGYVTFLAAPRGDSFRFETSAKTVPSPEAVAKGFLLEHDKAFGVLSPKVNFTTRRVTTGDSRTYVHLQQTYEGLPVFGSGVTVQVNSQKGIEYVLSDILRNAEALYSGQLSLIPGVSPQDAQTAGKSQLAAENPNLVFIATEPELVLFAPGVVGAVGSVKLAWTLDVASDYSTEGVPVAERMLIEAQSGGVVFRYPLIHDAKIRRIYDASNVPGDYTGILKRQENVLGPPNGPTGIADVDNAFDFYGDTYDFYFNTNGRDSIDDAGLEMVALVRLCPSVFSCPYQNAFWDGYGLQMYFGAGYTVDDVIGHELTHGVTQFSSDLIYYSESGALNESFSDVWGEFIDLTNTGGNDDPSVRWFMGEDVPGGAIRYMKNPPLFGDPDTYKGPYWYFGSWDNQGVHINSGVSNKLCYLLTDGDIFNSYQVDGIGIDETAKLYYEVQTNLLNPSSNYPDFGRALLQAADNLGYSQLEVINVARALLATKILKPSGEVLRHFRAQGTSPSQKVALAWRNPDVLAPITGIDIVRRTDQFPADPSDGVLVASLTSGEEWISDGPFAPGTELFYGMFPHPGSSPVNLPRFSRVFVGENIEYLTEGFSSGTDLSGKQITFVPHVNIETAKESGEPLAYVNYTSYAASIADGEAKVSPSFDGTLPVAKEDIFEIPLTDDGVVLLYPDAPIPLFGEFYSILKLSGNGFITGEAQEVYDDPLSAIASVRKHFEIPRISFLYSDLDPQSGGEVWARSLDDRVAITFENVPSYDMSYEPGQRLVNTVQCELFYNGTFRFTYLDVTTQRAVVGLSEGLGTPLDVMDVINDDPEPADAPLTDLTALPGSVPLELLPIPLQFVHIGDTAQFTAHALSLLGAVSYSLVDEPAGAAMNASTGAFSWDTTGEDPGVYSFLVCASAGGVDTCQMVNIYLSHEAILPTAEDVLVSPDEPRDNQALHASYTYMHPVLPEGPTVLQWFRDDALIPAYTNISLVPPGATLPGQKWYFTVMPATAQAGTDFYGNPIYYRGAATQSNIVTVLPDLKVDANKDGHVNSVDLQIVVGSLLGIQPEPVDSDVNSDGSTDVSDVQIVVNTILVGGEEQ